MADGNNSKLVQREWTVMCKGKKKGEFRESQEADNAIMRNGTDETGLVCKSQIIKIFVRRQR